MLPAKPLKRLKDELLMRQTNNSIIEAIKKQMMLPLFYHDELGVCLGITKALYSAGIRVIEFTNRGQMAIPNLKALATARNETMPDLLLAVGTIRTAIEVENFIDAGADFLISPVFDDAVCEAAKQRKRLWIPGCMTPTEIHVAETAGCKLIKLFPGNVLTPDFVAAIKDLFPQVDFMPTGGVDAAQESIAAWLNAGVCAVGIGSKLISKKRMDEKDYNAIEQETIKILALIESIIK
jgi:2-dehydro-3-deoxyphosphogluconate aldolase / (4S)-4-hydroxy-2-oxoglutarate aldolase